MNKQPAKNPRFTLIVNGQKEREYREEQKRQAELKAFVNACEALYEKNRAAQKIIYLQEDRP